MFDSDVRCQGCYFLGITPRAGNSLAVPAHILVRPRPVRQDQIEGAEALKESGADLFNGLTRRAIKA